MARSLAGTSSGDQINCGTGSILNLTAPISASAWVYPTNLTSLRQIIARNNNNTAYYGMYIQSNTHLIGQTNGGNVTGATSFSNGKWYQVGMVISGTTLTLYVNGASDNSGAVSVASQGSVVFTIGYDSVNAGREFAGSLADVAVWNAALTAGEMLALSSGMRPYMIRNASLVGYWPLDGLQSPEPDLSGNANNGTLTHTALAAGPPEALFTTPRSPRYEVFVPAVPTPFFGYSYPELSQRTYVIGN